MSLPHQRTQSGKLRAPKIRKDDPQLQRNRKTNTSRPGIENAERIDKMDPEDETSLYLQTPSALTETQMDTLLRAARGIGILSRDCIDKEWRCTWNIGRWSIGDDIYISANIVQPNLSVMWANLKNVQHFDIARIRNKYTGLRLESSSCEVKSLNGAVQIQGRWVPHVIDEAIETGLLKREDVDITYVNLSQSRLFFWLILDDSKRYFCTPTIGTIVAISSHLPAWSKAFTEINAGCSMSIKPDANTQVEDASNLGRVKRRTLTQLTVTREGWIQLVGNDSNVESLYRALSEGIRNTIESSGVTALIKSLEYNYLDE